MHHHYDIEKLSYFSFCQSSNAIFWIDKQGYVLHVNDAASKLTGFDKSELTGKKVYDFHPAHNKSTWDNEWKKLEKEKQFIFEDWYAKKDGTWIRIKIIRNLIEVDGMAYSVSIVEDKTAEYEMLEKIKERERRLSTLMANLPGMAYRCLYDENWTMEFVSEGCKKLTGYEPDDIIYNKQISYNELIYIDDRESVKNDIRNELNKHKHFELQYRIQLANDTIKWVWERGTIVSNGTEGKEVIEGFISDITTMKDAEAELIEKEKSLRVLKEQLEEETQYLREEIKLHSNFEHIISKSVAFRKVLMYVEKVANTDSTVLILGETGTGKELIARALHNNSSRSKRSLVTVNCAALPAEMIESELFGHEKGAFTGAYEKKNGRFEYANQGTVFLDEIGELPLKLQSKLLRVLQEGEFQRLGGTETIKTNVRVVAATNRDLEKAVRKGEFREDLYYRLNVFPIEVPPLRERKEDIPLLVNHFVNKYAAKTGKTIHKISQKVQDKLMQYNWPGNIRELENVIERAVILSENGRLIIGDWLPDHNVSANNRIVTLEALERTHILNALEATNWRVSGDKGAAKLLGVKRTTLQARMKKLGIYRPN
jgi:PAS domain S-box-containing protein